MARSLAAAAKKWPQRASDKMRAAPFDSRARARRARARVSCVGAIALARSRVGGSLSFYAADRAPLVAARRCRAHRIGASLFARARASAPRRRAKYARFHDGRDRKSAVGKRRKAAAGD